MTNRSDFRRRPAVVRHRDTSAPRDSAPHPSLPGCQESAEEHATTSETLQKISRIQNVQHHPNQYEELVGRVGIEPTTCQIMSLPL